MLEDKVAHYIQANSLIVPQARVLVAVSTGMDSMVLLTLLRKVQRQLPFEIGVVHINHKLRLASEEEEIFLQQYCEKEKLPFFHTRWKKHPQKGLEEQARIFRYDFFASVMRQEEYQILATAHHSDDQLETMLMKMLRDGNLFSAQGIVNQQPFQQGKLIRPLLTTSKAELCSYADQEKVPFFEDETNRELNVQRNRIRQLVIPQLKQENPQVLAHFQQLSEQLLDAQTIVSQQQEENYQQLVEELKEGLEIDVSGYLELSSVKQRFFWQFFKKKVLEQYQLRISQRQISQLVYLLMKDKASWKVDLENKWQFQKSYDSLILCQVEAIEEREEAHFLRLGESVFLSAHEWIGIFPLGAERIPEKTKLWSEYRQNLALDFPPEVCLRKRLAGDRIQLSPRLKKKVSRLLIDKKIPREKREKTWIMTGKNQTVLGILPYAISYLCNAKETAKIHYVLIYKYCELKPGRRNQC